MKCLRDTQIYCSAACRSEVLRKRDKHNAQGALTLPLHPPPGETLHDVSRIVIIPSSFKLREARTPPSSGPSP